MAQGYPARVMVGTERTHVGDYDAEIASEMWMSVPAVARSFDGVLVQGRLAGDGFPATYWIATSGAAAELGPRETTHGRLRLAGRSLRAGSATPRAGTPGFALPAGPAGDAGLELRLRTP